jgi:hypothetical protein
VSGELEIIDPCVMPKERLCINCGHPFRPKRGSERITCSDSCAGKYRTALQKAKRERSKRFEVEAVSASAFSDAPDVRVNQAITQMQTSVGKLKGGNGLNNINIGLALIVAPPEGADLGEAFQSSVQQFVAQGSAPIDDNEQYQAMRERYMMAELELRALRREHEDLKKQVAEQQPEIIVFDKLTDWVKNLPKPRLKSANIEIEKAILKLHNGNRTQTAKDLGISIRALREHIREMVE